MEWSLLWEKGLQLPGTLERETAAFYWGGGHCNHCLLPSTPPRKTASSAIGNPQRSFPKPAFSCLPAGTPKEPQALKSARPDPWKKREVCAVALLTCDRLRARWVAAAGEAHGLGPGSAMARPPPFPLARCPGCGAPTGYWST